jgi:hypothetical protein
MANFYTDTICTDSRMDSIARVSDIALLEPVTRKAVQQIILAAGAQGITLSAFETFRSQVRQQFLFTQGATKLQTVGVHHYGLACDLVVMIGGEPTWKVDYIFLQALAKQFGLIWGGDWGTPGTLHKFVDSDHVQRITIPQQGALFAGTWYPDSQGVA